MPRTVERRTPAKINLLLNVLGRRPDGFHDIETVLYPINVIDELRFTRRERGIQFRCTDPKLPTDSSNLVVRAAQAFFAAAKIREGAEIQLQKRIPIGAGLGGGSSDAAATLLGLNELFDQPLPMSKLEELTAALGSDVKFFLYSKPAIATGRGEKIQEVGPLRALTGTHLLVVYPGFGVSTAWAYQQLVKFPQALNGVPGRAQRLVELLQAADLQAAAAEFYNALEAPVFHKYPILAIYKEFLRESPALATLMSGSGSAVFAIFDSPDTATQVELRFKQKFGHACWSAVLPL